MPTEQATQLTKDNVDRFMRRNAAGDPLLPGGYGRSAYHVGGKIPPYAVRGEGWRVWDDSGREYIDANSNFTVLIHGNAHPQVMEAAARAMHAGASWGIPNEQEWELADRLINRLPGLDQVRFVNSGTEAVMSAIRVARAATGRDDVVMTKDGYHGSSDIAFSASGPTPGVPSSVVNSVSRVPINDIETLQRLFEESPERYAAVVIDLLPNKAGLIAIDPAYVALARELTRTHGAMLIFDEVISIRLGLNGLSGEYGVIPDLLTTGKMIGGGFPIGALIGRAELMSLIDPRRSDEVNLSGTFSGNPVAMAAGAKTLELFDAEAVERLGNLGNRARISANERVSDVGWEFRGKGSLLRAFPQGITKVPDKIGVQLWWELCDRGVLATSSGLVALSTPMSGGVVKDLEDRLVDAVRATADTMN